MDALLNQWEGGLTSVVRRPLADWLMAHPFLAWLVAHPLWALVLVGLGLLLLAGLWSAIARLTERFWLTLVRLPFQLMAWIFSGITGRLLRRSAPTAETAPDRLNAIVLRLENLQQEQALLLQEMHRLLAERTQE